MKIKRKFWRNVFRTLCRDKLAMIGGIIIITFLFAGLFAPFIAPHDPIAMDVEQSLLPPSFEYPFGTDQLGRCIFSRIIYGTRTSLANALVVLAGILAVGVPLGITAGYVGGWVGNMIMRLSDISSTFPSSLLALAVVGITGPNIHNIMIVFILLWWAPFARIIRGMVIQLKEKDFVTAAIAAGSSRFTIITKHILLNAISPIIVLSTLKVASIIMHLASFSFIGLGTQPPTADWGVMLNDSRQYITTEPLLMFWPGISIMLVIFGLNMFGEGLNEALRPVSGESLYMSQQGEEDENG